MNEADRIKDAVRNSIRNKPTPSRPLAGTVICPDCKGTCHMWHFIPNLPKLFGMVSVRPPCGSGGNRAIGR